MTMFRVGPAGIPATLKTDMNSVLNKKFGTSTDYPPNDWPETVDLMGPLEEKTVSGSIASFPDGADDVPIKSLVANLPASLTPYESIEVIHAGGNILETNAQSKTQNGITWTVNQDGSVTLEGTSTARTYLYVHGYHKIISKDATLTVSVEGLKDNGSYDVFVNLPYSEDGTLYKGTYGQLTYDHPSKTIQYTADKYIGFLIDCPANVTTNQTIKIMVSGGSSAMDFEPYEAPTTYEIDIPNPNPDIFDFAGGNYQRGAWKADGTVNPDEWSCRAYKIPIEVGATYDIFGEGFFTLVTYFDSNDTFISSETLTKSADFHELVTIPANCAYLGVSYEGFFVMETKYIKKAFNVYGGSIDAISGEGESTHANVKVSDLTWTKQTASGRDFFITQVSNMKTGTPKDIDSVLPYGGEITVAAMADKSLASWTNSLRIYDTDITTVSELLEAYGNNGISYPLATTEPFSVSAIAVNSKAGSNNIWNDAGDSSVTYRSAGTMTPVLPTLIEKTVTENGEYLASSDNADGFSKVTVNVESIVKIGINSGKLNISNGTITTDSAWCYTDAFDCPSGNITMDFGESDLNVGIELVNASDNSHANYWSCGNDLRYREVDLSSYYSPTKKARLSFKKANLSKVLLMDFGNGKIYSPLTAAQFEETQTE